ncbi:uncharacterized protein LOC143185127 [Calliopsis andreniformis]|uniref:uncharacterized protein LOC143185127 n=1 Tax=Calliopsis andreniformis TaxID=337506 RepID=UPI003FCDD559
MKTTELSCLPRTIVFLPSSKTVPRVRSGASRSQTWANGSALPFQPLRRGVCTCRRCSQTVNSVSRWNTGIRVSIKAASKSSDRLDLLVHYRRASYAASYCFRTAASGVNVSLFRGEVKQVDVDRLPHSDCNVTAVRFLERDHA